MASPWNFENLDAGSDWVQGLRWTTASRDEDGNVVRDPDTHKIVRIPVDLTGWTAKMQIRDKKPNGRLLATLGTPDLSVRDGDISLGGVTGQVTFSLPGAKTERWQHFGKVVYDVEMVSPSNQKIRWLEGTIEVSPQVTL